jgi:tRNA threonylcarbamoyladenosine biosynthesis protein TsaE
VTRDAAATRALGRALGQVAGRGAVILLVGDLGAGKTTFAQGLALGLGVTADVVSPSFALVREYEGVAGGPRLVHMDFYRLGGAPEVRDLGLDDYFDGDDVVAIEWPDRAEGALGGEALVVTIVREGEARRITFSARGPAARLAVASVAAPSGVASP